jgi:hypothetical protein
MQKFALGETELLDVISRSRSKRMSAIPHLRIINDTHLDILSHETKD